MGGPDARIRTFRRGIPFWRVAWQAHTGCLHPSRALLPGRCSRRSGRITQRPPERIEVEGGGSYDLRVWIRASVRSFDLPKPRFEDNYYGACIGFF